MKSTDSYVLKQDLVIPAGTIFNAAPNNRSYVGEFTETTIGFGKDNTGTLTVSLDKGIEEFFIKVIK